MIKLFYEKLKESMMSVLPIAVLVLILCCFFKLLVPVTLVVLEAVRVVPVLERDSPLRACAYASDSNATNVNAVNIAASVAVIVLIIVQF